MTELIASKVQELCARLTERGVEYTVKLNGRMVEWDVDGVKWCAYEEGDQLRLWMAGSVAIEPARAVAATLRPGTCHEEENEDTGFICCSECGAVLPDDYTVYYCWSCGAKVVDS